MPTLLDLDQLRTLIAIADTGSFTRAAEEVHKTQSAVSMQMKRLEERLGRPLFLRDGRQSRLTADGQKLLEYARRLIRLNGETVNALLQPELSGTVQIGIPDDYADRLLPRLLAAFARTYPKIEVAVTCRETSAVARMVDAGELDLAILSGGDEGVGGQVFRRERLLWVGSEHHAAHLLDPLPLALGPQSCNWRQCAIDALDAIDRAYRIAYVSGSAAPLSGAVLAGLAVSTLPESAVRPGMRILRSEDGFPLLPPCDIVLMRARHATQATHEALVDHILHNLSNLGPSNLGPSNLGPSNLGASNLGASNLEAAQQAAE